MKPSGAWVTAFRSSTARGAFTRFHRMSRRISISAAARGSKKPRPGKTTRNGGQTGNLAQDPDPMLRRLVAEVAQVQATADGFRLQPQGRPQH